MQQIAWDYYVGLTTVHCIIKETCKVLYLYLQPLYLREPTTEDFEKTANGFMKRWNMPNCFGALDGKHVAIQSPKFSGSEFFNYKKTFSLVLMATCDAYYRFTMVDIGAAGSNHDSTVFKTASFGRKLMGHSLGVPPPSLLPRSNALMPHFIVADQAFPLHMNIMRPYPGQNLSEEQKVFNYRLSRARRVIENAFGILTQRWRILRKSIIANVNTCEDMTKAVVVLHNYLQASEEDIPETERGYCGMGMVDREDGEGNVVPGPWRQEAALPSVRRLGTNNSTREAQQNRNTLASYFMSDVGCLPWQIQYVRRGTAP